MAVVSAQGVIKSASGCLEEDKVTSILYECLELASARNPKVHIVLKQLRDRHFRVAKDLLGGDSLELKRFLEELDEDFVDLEQILRTVWLCGGSWKQDWWTGYGEIWSARLMAAFLGKTKKVDWLDARKVLVVKPHPMGVVPDIETSKRKLAEWISQNQHLEIIVVTGYICSLADGSPCTLGRDGSDYSASIFAVLCDAASVTIWTDVDGVYSANPNVVKNAVVRPQLSYAEAMELAYFGAKVIHPKTMTPVIVHKIPVYIRNTFAPQNPGSCICAPEFIKKSPVVTQGFSCIQNLALVNVEGSGMIGVPGVARRLFQAVQEAQCSVVLITQAGSEHSISFAVPFSQSDTVVKAICKEFQNELESKEIQTVEKTGPVACLASVGDGMKRTTGMAGKVLGALASKEINIIAIAQGSSERNISVIIDQKEADIAVKVVHDSFVNMDSKISCW